MVIGIHSIERNAQEDMLLVLFNTAMSNMVRGFLVPRTTSTRADISHARFYSETTSHFQGILQVCV